MTPFGFVLSVATLVVGLLLGYFSFWLTPKPVQDDYADCLIHPETTPQVKWVKMTRPRLAERTRKINGGEQTT